MPPALPPAPACVEADCDRLAAAGDQRCDLHSSRLGPLARAESAPALAAPENVHDVSRTIDVPVGPDRFPWRIWIAIAATLTWVAHVSAAYLMPIRFTAEGQYLNLFAIIVSTLTALLAGLFAWQVARTLPRRIAAGSTVVLAAVPWLVVLAAAVGVVL